MESEEEQTWSQARAKLVGAAAWMRSLCAGATLPSFLQQNRLAGARQETETAPNQGKGGVPFRRSREEGMRG